MKFQDENFSGEIVESDKLRWAVLDDGRKIPATIMLDYFRGVVPESVIHEILGESVKMHRIKERNKKWWKLKMRFTQICYLLQG